MLKSLFKSVLYGTALIVAVLGCKKDEDELGEMIPETDKDPTTSQIQGYVFRPALAPASDENVNQLKVPAGFTVAKFAEGLGKPRILAVGSTGQVYATDREAGTVTMLRVTNGDGKSDEKKVVANIKQVHGITIYQGKMYLVSVKEVYVAPMNTDGTLGTPQLLINDLPDGGQHPNRTIAFGPDGLMYLTVGSTCNACPEPNGENATILRADANGKNRKVFAKGLRNTIGFGWHPQTQRLYGMDHGIDWLGDDEQKEELNVITQNADYGWPYIYGEGKYNPADRPMGDTTYQQYSAKTTKPVLTYQAHAAPMGMIFYNGSQFPAEYQNSAFIAMRGSWNRSVPSGYKVVRLRFENGEPKQFEDFLTGFLVNGNRSHFARLVGIAQYNDGSLLVSDDTNGVIYRVSYAK